MFLLVSERSHAGFPLDNVIIVNPVVSEGLGTALILLAQRPCLQKLHCRLADDMYQTEAADKPMPVPAESLGVWKPVCMRQTALCTTIFETPVLEPGHWSISWKK